MTKNNLQILQQQLFQGEYTLGGVGKHLFRKSQDRLYT